MTGRQLIARLKALRGKLPPVGNLNLQSPELQKMLGEAEALVGMWSMMDAVAINIKTQFLHITTEVNYLQVINVIEKVLYELEIQYPEENKKQVYAAGEAYDFYNDFRSEVLRAKSSIFLIDPYANEEVFNLYVERLPKSVSCRVLLGKIDNNLRTVIGKLGLSATRSVEVRQSKAIHDRVVFIDGMKCWIMGQSIKDAAKRKPTYLVELPEDLAPEKLSYYESIWSSARAL